MGVYRKGVCSVTSVSEENCSDIELEWVGPIDNLCIHGCGKLGQCEALGDQYLTKRLLNVTWQRVRADVCTHGCHAAMANRGIIPFIDKFAGDAGANPNRAGRALNDGFDFQRSRCEKATRQ